MGKDKTSSSTQSKTTVERTAEQKELEQILLKRERATDPAQTQAQLSGLDLSNRLLTGAELPGGLAGLPGGINEEVTKGIVQKSLADIRPGLQASGLLNSGIRAELEAETAKDIRLQSEQFNINNLMQLLNLAVGGQAQALAGSQAGAGQLGTMAMSAAGRTSDSSTRTAAMNPFLKSFQTSLGSSLGSGSFGSSGDTAGGMAKFFGAS